MGHTGRRIEPQQHTYIPMERERRNDRSSSRRSGENGGREKLPFRFSRPAET